MAAAKTHKIWTTEDENLLKLVIKQDLSYERLCSKYFPDRTASSLRSRAKKLGLDNNYQYRRNFFDESFWDTPNLLNSFWAGTMAADGNISEVKGVAQSLNWEISDVDEKYLDKFVRDCKFTGKKYYWKKTNNSGSFTNSVKVRIHSRKWVEVLGRNFNVIPRKSSRISIPEYLSEDLKMAWLIGYINGDGCIHLGKKNPKNEYGQKLSISITSASFDIIKWITDFSNSKLVSKHKKIRKVGVGQGVNTYYYTGIGGQPAVQMFIYLSQFKVPILERKWRDEQILNHIKEEYLKSPESYNSYIWDQNSFIVDFLNGGPAQ